MKLYDIRTALKNLVRINKDLNKDRLHFLLLSAGWEDQDIKDALSLWESHSYEDISSEDTGADLIVKEDMTPSTEIFEDLTTTFSQAALSKEEPSIQETKKESTESVTGVTSFSVKDDHIEHIPLQNLPIQNLPRELITKEIMKIKESISDTVPAYISKQTSHEELPHNLPLRPHESSHVVVPLKEYEKRFVTRSAAHVETMQTHKAYLDEQSKTLKQASVQVEIKKEKEEFVPVTSEAAPLRISKVVEAPLETEDKYLAFVASVLFLLIMFILGYMHIIGRI